MDASLPFAPKRPGLSCAVVAIALAWFAASGTSTVRSAPTPTPAVFSWEASLTEIRRAIETNASVAQTRLAELRAQQPALSAPNELQLALLQARTELALGRTEQSLEIVGRSRLLARRLGDRVSEGEADIIASMALQEFSKFEDSKAAAGHALTLFQGQGAERLEAEALYRHAILYVWTKEIDLLLPIAVKLEEMAAASADPTLHAWSHAAMGSVFYQNNRFAEAAEHYDAMLNDARRSGSIALEGSALDRLAAANGRLGDRPKAEALFREALSRFRTCGRKSATLTVLLNLALNLKNQQRPAEAMPLIDEAIAKMDTSQTSIGLPNLLVVRSGCQLMLGRPEAALADAERAYALVGQIGRSGRTEGEAAEQISLAASAIGDFRRAYEMSIVAANNARQVASERTAQQVLELETRYATERKQADIRDLNRRNELQSAELIQRRLRLRLVWILAVASLTIATVTSYFLVRLRTANQRLTLANTELHLARQQADASSEAKSRFLANMSHEIRTPMNSIIGLANLLVQAPLNRAQAEMSRTIIQSAESLLTILNDILDFSKIEAGKLTFTPVDFKLRHETHCALAPFEPLASAKGLTFRKDFPDDCEVTVHGDPVRFRQVLTNLVGNAIKFTPHGEIAISLRPQLATRSGGFAFRLEVSDTGVGIPAAVQPLLFQSFTQADGGTTRRFGGTGLGLAISRQLVELMHGRIGFTSAEGQGSLFWVELELPRGQAASAPVRAVTAPGVSGKALRLLVAEDNAANQLVARGLFESLGHRVTMAGDGVEAIKQLRDQRYDIVLMDCQMPVCDGYTATRRIRSGEILGVDPRVPIVAVTAHALPADRAACLAAGMDDYVSKPLDPDELDRAFATCGLHLGARQQRIDALRRDSASVFDEAILARFSTLVTAEGRPLDEALVELFLKEGPARLTEIKTCIAHNDGPGLAAIAHKFAGSAAGLGAHPLRNILRELESLARISDWARIAGVLTGVEREWQQLRPVLENRAGSHA